MVRLQDRPGDSKPAEFLLGRMRSVRDRARGTQSLPFSTCADASAFRGGSSFRRETSQVGEKPCRSTDTRPSVTDD
jgi:hypothetical protein